jgi:hypothetical protein
MASATSIRPNKCLHLHLVRVSSCSHLCHVDGCDVVFNNKNRWNFLCSGSRSATHREKNRTLAIPKSQTTTL